MKFDFDDILLVPEVISFINSRKEVKIFDIHGMLPIMTAPMDTVVDYTNLHHFYNNKIYSILPRKAYEGSERSILSNSQAIFHSYSLEEFLAIFIESDAIDKSKSVYALIDVANGHMEKLRKVVQMAKEKYGKSLVLMIGNIANPSTYTEYAKLDVDYIRCGIGSGSACTTSANVAIGYPMGSLISECYNLKLQFGFSTKIVADGGFKNYSDIIKALALGADYVMLGGILNKALESCGEEFIEENYYNSKEKCFTNLVEFEKLHNSNKDQYPCNMTSFKAREKLMKEGKLYKKYRGMSTKDVQKDWGKEDLKTSEGIVKINKVEYTLSRWSENFEDYLRSAMSYCNSRTLEDFKGSRYELITQNSFNRFNK